MSYSLDCGVPARRPPAAVFSARAVLGLVSVLLVFGAAACGSALPESGTPAAALYVRRCGTCHPPYNPQLMTPMMWQTMVGRMEGEMSRRGIQLAPEDKSQILDYLTRNAGTS